MGLLREMHIGLMPPKGPLEWEVCPGVQGEKGQAEGKGRIKNQEV